MGRLGGSCLSLSVGLCIPGRPVSVLDRVGRGAVGFRGAGGGAGVGGGVGVGVGLASQREERERTWAGMWAGSG